MEDFKETFKYFKQIFSNSKLTGEALDFELENITDNLIPFKNFTENNKYASTCNFCIELGLIPHQQWDVYTVADLTGFLLIKNPFTIEGQQLWIQNCLETYPRKPSITNLDLHYKSLDDIWALQKDSDPIKCKLIDKLSWATFGYHHNWDTKIYDPNKYSKFPESLAKLSKHIASCLNFQTFKPEAAIVNYYHSKSSLGIHNDHSEVELGEPIISISFGQSAIFLVGTQMRTDKPIATCLKSGDIVVLSGSSRLAYHAVPVIIQKTANDRYFNSEIDINNETWKDFYEYIQKHRINISIRQVYPDHNKKSL